VDAASDWGTAGVSVLVRQYDSAKVCGLVWTANFIAYRCRTCGISPCMSLCPDCFYGADHTGHDFNMFRSHAGGACDCGDVSVMKPDGYVELHTIDWFYTHFFALLITLSFANCLCQRLGGGLNGPKRNTFTKWAGLNQIPDVMSNYVMEWYVTS